MMYKNKTSIYCFIVALLVMHYMIGKIPSIPNVVMGGVFIFTISLVWQQKNIVLDKFYFAFLLYLPFTIISAMPDPVFRSWERLGLFVLLYLVASPVLQSEYIRMLRRKMLFYIIFICVILSIGSFIGYFLGFNFCTINLKEVTDYQGVAGHFSGLTKQSMYLGPISGISAIYFLDKFLFKKKILYLLLLIGCLGSLLFASSRGAFGATLIGCLSILFLHSQSKLLFLKKVFIIGLVLLLSFPFWKFATEALQNKQEIHRNKTEMFDSRTGKVEARFFEFSTHPLLGVGFSAILPNGNDSYNKITGTIEPGSSWLGILSMTGVIGFVLFCIILGRAYRGVLLATDDFYLIGLLIFYCIHMFIEGYVFAAGNPISFILWLIMGVSYDKKFSLKY